MDTPSPAALDESHHVVGQEGGEAVFGSRSTDPGFVAVTVALRRALIMSASSAKKVAGAQVRDGLSAPPYRGVTRFQYEEIMSRGPLHHQPLTGFKALFVHSAQELLPHTRIQPLEQRRVMKRRSQCSTSPAAGFACAVPSRRR